MRAYFSKRHREAIAQSRLDCSLPYPLRTSILRVLEKHSDTGWYEGERFNITFDEAEETLKTFYGAESLRAYKGRQLVNAHFAEVVKSGWPPLVFDCIEAWFDHAPDATGSPCESEVNQVLAIHDSQWRFLNGGAILIDSAYLHEEIIAPALTAMRDQGAIGALQEFTQSQEYLRQGSYKESVVAAHKSVESIMKCVLETDEHLTFGQLLSRVLQSGIVPEYYEEFLSHFEKLALAAVKERNRPGAGHGQGKDVAEIPRGLAQFAVHLAGCMNLFLLERWVEHRAERQQALVEPEDLPFE